MENNEAHQPTTADTAAANLAFIHADGANAATAAIAPLWYHLAQSASIAAFILAFSLPMNWFITTLCGAAIISTILGFLRPRLTRVQTSPWERSPSLRIGLQLLALLLVLGIGGVWLYTTSGQLWILLVAAALAFGLTLFLGQRMEKAFINSFSGAK